ncbi:MAG: ABC transporter substrate-binding protein [Okeania sp. SIO2G4]|uniref:ABC transporter substrate-binding protein n=1 Tax=unclassified Okeania TaxID=2634635 RepID=UPI0013B72FBE|nr:MULTISPECIES: ABC transporter substrate-binding protein [unclassified Okeania]NEP38741.1 ABC transporter substrate-binding protein [Okeania sp. SIO2H7]NEP72165.1 ABC transporter substrate-binding protein [Okeania sp. SIO2G5]NEP91814.1 ABC transporter substrate-binding protein [Okeania sp. SIO2F5]NEQ90778.1 ABC transporter substrate-binding protein [Okeania sp. SIO2G4]
MNFKIYLTFKFFFHVGFSLSLVGLTACQTLSDPKEGITHQTIRLGSILALEGQEEILGNRMKSGLKAALDNQLVQAKKIKLIFENDYYEPSVAHKKTQQLIQSGIFLMIGNVGTPTAKQTLPILKKNNIPAIGFYTGSELLRSPSQLIINYRASYAQEIEAVVKMALNAGVKPYEICAYVQDDSYGISGLKGVRHALVKAQVEENILRPYDQVLEYKEKGNEDNPFLSPVGFYPRNTPYVKEGYNSLKKWEKNTGRNCRLVVTAGTSTNIARFIKLAQEKREDWVISSLSFAHAEELQFDLEEYGIKDKVILTEVVPSLNSDLPIVQEAKYQLKNEFDRVSLEGYIVGKMTLKILQTIPGEINRDSFLKQVTISQFDLGGVSIDFTQGRTQSSDLVLINVLTPQGFKHLKPDKLRDIFQ